MKKLFIILSMVLLIACQDEMTIKRNYVVMEYISYYYEHNSEPYYTKVNYYHRKNVSMLQLMASYEDYDEYRGDGTRINYDYTFSPDN